MDTRTLQTTNVIVSNRANAHTRPASAQCRRAAGVRFEGSAVGRVMAGEHLNGERCSVVVPRVESVCAVGRVRASASENDFEVAVAAIRLFLLLP